MDAVLSDGTLLGARSDSKGGKPPGVQIRPDNYEKWARRAILELELASHQDEQWEKYLLSQVGLAYDKSDILGLILGRPMTSKGHWICSALQLAALEAADVIEDTFCIKPQQCPPNTLAAIGCALGGKWTMVTPSGVGIVQPR